MEKLPVIFRRDKQDSAIVAIFPTIWETGNTFLCYAHIGQHGSAAYEYYRNDTVPASEEDSAALYKELWGIYEYLPGLRPDLYGEPVQLVVKRRMSPAMRAAWLANRTSYGSAA